MLNLSSLQLPEPRTPLYPLIQKQVADVARPIVERLEAWRMMNARASLNTTRFDGKPIHYQGVPFDGTPRVVFWGDFFEPFMYDAAQRASEWVIATCRDRHLDSAEYLSEAKRLLNVLIAAVYEEMATTDQHLRGRGFPKSASRMAVGHKVEAMQKKVNDLVVALRNL